MNPKLFWIPGPWRGKLAVASRPRGGDWLEDEIEGWRKAGLDVVVSLLEEDEAAQFELSHEGDVAESKGVRFKHLPTEKLVLTSWRAKCSIQRGYDRLLRLGSLRKR